MASVVHGQQVGEHVEVGGEEVGNVVMMLVILLLMMLVSDLFEEQIGDAQNCCTCCGCGLDFFQLRW